MLIEKLKRKSKVSHLYRNLCNMPRLNVEFINTSWFIFRDSDAHISGIEELPSRRTSHLKESSSFINPFE